MTNEEIVELHFEIPEQRKKKAMQDEKQTMEEPRVIVSKTNQRSSMLKLESLE